MKVLHFAHSFVPVYGGTTTRLHNLLASKVNDHYLYVPQAPSRYAPTWMSRLKGYETIDNINVRRVPLVNKGLTKLPLLGYIRHIQLNSDRLVHYVKEEEIDIVHGHNPLAFAVAAMKYAKQRKLPFIHEAHGLVTDSFYRKQSKVLSIGDTFLLLSRQIAKGKEKKVFKNADFVITLTARMKQRIIELFSIKKSKIKVIPNGVDGERFNPAQWSEKSREFRRNRGWEEKIVLMYCGHLDKINGIDFLLNSVKDLQKLRNKVKIVILGRGPLQRHVERVSRETDFIDYLGLVDYKDMPMYYSSCDIFIIPRTSTLLGEILVPIKLLETMSMEKAVLVSNVNAMTDVVVDHENGFVFQKGSRVDLFKKVKYLIENPDMLNFVGKKARDFVVHNYSWLKAREALQEVYEEAVSKEFDI